MQATGGDRTADQRQNRSVGAAAESGRRARGPHQKGWPERRATKRCTTPCSAVVRPQVEVQLRYRARHFMSDPKHPLAIEPGLGLVDAPFDIPNLRIESGESGSPYQDRLVPLGQQHRACVQHPVCRDRPRTQPRPFLLELIGPARIVDLSKQVTTLCWDNGEPTGSYPIDTGRLRHTRRAPYSGGLLRQHHTQPFFARDWTYARIRPGP